MANLTKQPVKSVDYVGLNELFHIEVMKNYNLFIVSLAMKYVPTSKKVIDFGSGIGTLALILRDSFQVPPVCLEIDETNKLLLAKRGFAVVDVFADVKSEVDLIFSSNVLEHIEDDVAVLREMKAQLKEDGKIFLYLPAKMMLWTKLDEEVGHYRRYEYIELVEKCKKAGLKIEKIHFADSLGFFASFAMKVFGYNKHNGIGSKASLRFYDRWFFPLSNFFDTLGCKYFFGKNIVLVAKR